MSTWILRDLNSSSKQTVNKLIELASLKKAQIKIILILGISSLAFFLALCLFFFVESFPGHGALNSWLLERLVSIQPLPDDFEKLYPHSNKIIYVLGGSQNSLNYRFKTAAGLYQKKTARKIIILSRPGITEYDPSLRRNLTNDEWSVKRLEELGVEKEYVEPLSFKYGFFGTLTEARGVSQEVINKGYDVLILVSSPYHTARVRESFSKYLRGKNINVFIYRSDDYPRLWGLVLEYFKLVLYKNILL
jgi:uncharacterized SAM-binding protein YcdF (DUF218 family)